MKCKYEILLPEFLSRDLNKTEYHQLREHLKLCKSCTKTLQSFQQIDKLLNKVERPTPDARLLAIYHAGLEKHFKTDKIHERLLDIIKNFRHTQSRAIRWAQIGIVVCFCLFIGWFIFYSGQKTQVVPTIQPKHGLQLTEQDILLVKDFFSETQLVLEAMMKTSQTELNQASGLDEKRKTAQSLLMKTFIIHELALQLENKSILDILTKLELVLYEISNLTQTELSESLEAIQLLIRESGLLPEVVDFNRLV